MQSAMEACHRELNGSRETCTGPWGRETLKGPKHYEEKWGKTGVSGEGSAACWGRCEGLTHREDAAAPEAEPSGRSMAPKNCVLFTKYLWALVNLIRKREKGDYVQILEIALLHHGNGFVGEEWVTLTPFSHGPLCWFYMKQSPASTKDFMWGAQVQTWAKSLGRQNVQL